MNQWIAEAKVDPVEACRRDSTPRIGHPSGAEPWEVTDVIATGALVAGIFGKGGGDELGAATALQEATPGARRQAGHAASGADFRSADDPEAPATVHGKKFPYRTPPKGKAKGMAMPDPGSVEPVPIVAEGDEPRRSPAGSEFPGLLERPASRSTRASNALRRLGEGVRDGQPDRRLRPADRLLRAAAADGAGRPRPRRARGPRDRRARGRLRRHQPLRAARPRAGLRVVGDLSRPRHHRHLRGPPLRPRRQRARRAHSTSYVFQRPSARRWTCSSTDQHAGPRTSPTTRRPARETLRVLQDQGRASSPRPRPIKGKPLRLHEAPRDLLPRGRLGRLASRT